VEEVKLSFGSETTSMLIIFCNLGYALLLAVATINLH
jgi:hypothetical protein